MLHLRTNLADTLDTPPTMSKKELSSVLENLKNNNEISEKEKNYLFLKKSEKKKKKKDRNPPKT